MSAEMEYLREENRRLSRMIAPVTVCMYGGDILEVIGTWRLSPDEHDEILRRVKAAAAWDRRAPSAEAEMRERAARVAMARYDEHKAVARAACFSQPPNAILLTFSQARYDEADTIAAAIRALPLAGERE